MLDLNERRKKALDAVTEIAKQLITLSTGVVALSLTFAKDVFVGRAPAWLLVASWVLYALAICFGIVVLMAIAGTLDPLHPPIAQASPAHQPFLGTNVRRPAAAQIIMFLLATALSIAYGIVGVACSQPSNADAAHVDGGSTPQPHATEPPATRSSTQ